MIVIVSPHLFSIPYKIGKLIIYTYIYCTEGIGVTDIVNHWVPHPHFTKLGHKNYLQQNYSNPQIQPLPPENNPNL